MANSVTKTVVSICIAGGLFVAGCANSDNGRQQMPFQTVEKGSVPPTQVTNGIYVLRTAAEWSRFWSALKSSLVPQPSLPSVDFSQNGVIAVVDYSRSTGGYSVTITQVLTSSVGCVVRAVHQSPGPDCLVTLAFDQPYHIVTTPAFSGEATLDLTETVLNCSAP